MNSEGNQPENGKNWGVVKQGESFLRPFYSTSFKVLSQACLGYIVILRVLAMKGT